MYRTVNDLSYQLPIFPAQVNQIHALHSCFSFDFVNVSLFAAYLVSFLHFLCLFLVISVFKMASKCSAEVPSTFLDRSRPWCFLRRQYLCWIRYIRAWVIVSLAVSSTITTQDAIIWMFCVPPNFVGWNPLPKVMASKGGDFVSA